MTELDDFRRGLTEGGYAARSVKSYLNYTTRAVDALDSSLVDADADDLAAFWRTIPGSSARRQCRKALMAFYTHRGGVNPALSLPAPPEPNRLPRPLTPDEYDRFLRAATGLGGRHEVVGWMFGLTGCRFSELRSAHWSDVALSAPASWTIRGKGSGRRGPKLRVVPLHPLVVTVLARQRLGDGRTRWVLTDGAAGPVTEYSLRRVFVGVCEAAGLEGVTPHRLRHTVGTRALEGTRDLRAVQELLGHASVATTQVYTKVLPGRLCDAVAALLRDGPTAA